jgi:hypothetical protein
MGRGAEAIVTIRDWTTALRSGIVALSARRSCPIADQENHTMAQILPNLAQELELAKAENARLLAALQAANKPRALTMKVTASKTDEKTGKVTGTSGAISIYGLGRFPITLYRSQWERLIANIGEVEAFILANSHLLASKE